MAEQVLSLNHAEGYVDLASGDSSASLPSDGTIYSDRLSTVSMQQGFVCKDQSKNVCTCLQVEFYFVLFFVVLEMELWGLE